MRKWIIGLIGIGTLGIIYFLYNPENYLIFPKCPFLLLTGLKCPGCGSQRAIHSLLHLEFINAFKYNVLLVISLPYIGGLFLSGLNKAKYATLYHMLHKPTLIKGYFVLVIVWWFMRNICNL